VILNYPQPVGCCPTPTHIVGAHEIVHGIQMSKGLTDKSEHPKYGIGKSEVAARIKENEIRERAKEPARVHPVDRGFRFWERPYIEYESQ